MTTEGTTPQFLPIYMMAERDNRADFYPVSHHDTNYTNRKLISEVVTVSWCQESNKSNEKIQFNPPKSMIENNAQNTDDTTSIPTQPTQMGGTLFVRKSMLRPTASEQFVFELDPAAMEQITQAMATINQRISDYFNRSTRGLFIGSGLQQNPLNKCQDCVWFNKTANFCAVSPRNLTSVECGDHQTSEPPENLDYLEARSPERIVLIQDLAQNLDIKPEMLEQKLFQGCLNTNEPFGLTSLGLLSEIETIGAYSIAQMELIRDGIRLNVYPFFMVCGTIKEMILEGCSFSHVVRRLILGG